MLDSALTLRVILSIPPRPLILFLLFRCHPFVVTREDGDKTQGVALIFYEEVKDLNICHAVHTLQKMYSTEAAEGGTLKRTDRLRPRSAKDRAGASERSRSLPRHYQQVRLIIVQQNFNCMLHFYSRTKLLTFVVACRDAGDS